MLLTHLKQGVTVQFIISEKSSKFKFSSASLITVTLIIMLFPFVNLWITLHSEKSMFYSIMTSVDDNTCVCIFQGLTSWHTRSVKVISGHLCNHNGTWMLKFKWDLMYKSIFMIYDHVCKGPLFVMVSIILQLTKSLEFSPH